MNRMKKILALALALCMMLCVCTACGDDSGNSSETPGSGTVESQPGGEQNGDDVGGGEQNDGTVTYTVTVVDEDGNPVAGALVQICKDACIPGATDENGIAQFNVAEDAYKVSFVMMPEGYTAEEAEFYFDDGSREMTIVLTPAG